MRTARSAELKKAAAATTAAEKLAEQITAHVTMLGQWVAPSKLVSASGLSSDEVRHLVAGDEAEQAPAPVAATRPAVVPLGERTLKPGAALVDQAVTRMSRAHRSERVSMFVHIGRGIIVCNGQQVTWPGVGLVNLLTMARMHGARRIYVCDGPDWCVTDADSTRVDAVTRWITQPVEGWLTAPAGHYVADPETPTGRWEHAESGYAVELYRAGAWFGVDFDGSPMLAAAAMERLSRIVGAAFQGAVLLATPTTTGRDLWIRSIPAGREIPILSEELRELISSTSGQGRTEFLPPDRPGEPIPAMAYVDGRLMYAGLATYSMPYGPPTWVKGEPDDRHAVLKPSRWRITATVPEGWDHVGLIMAPAAGGDRTWEYPSEPGRTMTTWADGREVALARDRGWRVDIHEGVMWPEGKPLTRWAEQLTNAYAAVESEMRSGAIASDLGRLVRAGIRSIVLFTIGGFSQRGRLVMRTAPADRPELVPADARPVDGMSLVGDSLVWHERERTGAWSTTFAHPEFSSIIWARCRTRLLTGPCGAEIAGKKQYVGALHLPRGAVLAFSTDALYLTDDPRWPDDGKPGRLRTQAITRGPFTYPESFEALRALRRRAAKVGDR